MINPLNRERKKFGPTKGLDDSKDEILPDLQPPRKTRRKILK
jgi:hypothetical protein